MRSFGQDRSCRPAYPLTRLPAHPPTLLLILYVHRLRIHLEHLLRCHQRTIILIEELPAGVLHGVSHHEPAIRRLLPRWRTVAIHVDDDLNARVEFYLG